MPHSKRLNPATGKVFKHGFISKNTPFVKDNRVFDTYQTNVLRKKTGYCKEIWRTIEGYEESLRYDRRRRKFLKSKFDAIINKIKTDSGCMHCKNHFKDDPEILDFHHVNPKTKNVSYFRKSSYAQFEKALEEVEKCIVLCANCHRKETKRIRNATKN